MNAFDEYELDAALFYKQTRLMAPGKSEPLCDFHSFEERNEAWIAWQAANATTLKEIYKLTDELANYQWRPIEEAPKDSLVVVIGYPINGKAWPIFRDGDGIWFSLDESEHVCPTHFIPMPQPPEVK